MTANCMEYDALNLNLSLSKFGENPNMVLQCFSMSILLLKTATKTAHSLTDLLKPVCNRQEDVKVRLWFHLIQLQDTYRSSPSLLYPWHCFARTSPHTVAPLFRPLMPELTMAWFEYSSPVCKLSIHSDYLGEDHTWSSPLLLWTSGDWYSEWRVAWIATVRLPSKTQCSGRYPDQQFYEQTMVQGHGW